MNGSICRAVSSSSIWNDVSSTGSKPTSSAYQRFSSVTAPARSSESNHTVRTSCPSSLHSIETQRACPEREVVEHEVFASYGNRLQWGVVGFERTAVGVVPGLPIGGLASEFVEASHRRVEVVARVQITRYELAMHGLQDDQERLAIPVVVRGATHPEHAGGEAAAVECLMNHAVHGYGAQRRVIEARAVQGDDL